MAGILGAAFTPDARPDGRSGLGQLLGSAVRPSPSQIRPFILRAALVAVAESFRADGAVLAILQPQPGEEAVGARSATAEATLITHLPPSWDAGSGVMFELYGRLWSLSQVSPESDRSWSDQYRVGDHNIWIARLPGADGPVGVAFVRPSRFDSAESHALERSMTSAVYALSVAAGQWPVSRWRSGPPVRPVPALSASVAGEGGMVVAEVTVRGPAPAIDHDCSGVAAGAGCGESRGGAACLETSRDDGVQATVTGTGRGRDVATAVARAAANACQPQRSISFAGSLEFDDSTVTIVLVGGLDLDGRLPRLGVSVRPSGDVLGPAEAVFIAAGAD